MKTLAFEGYSDDTFGEYNITRDDYDNCASGKPIRYLITVPDHPGGMLVVGQHGRDDLECSWMIGVGAYDPEHDDVPLPSWPVRMLPSTRTPYSPRLEVDAPDNFVLTCLERQPEKQD